MYEPEFMPNCTQNPDGFQIYSIPQTDLIILQQQKYLK